MTGIKNANNRPKTASHLKSKKSKNFKNEDPAAKARYALKLAHRAARKIKKANKHGRRISVSSSSLA